MTTPFSKTEWIEKIERSWQELQTYIAGLEPSQFTTPKDPAGWTILDHLTHLAKWEETILMLFQDQPRHQTLGIERSFFRGVNIDAINEIVRSAISSLTIQQGLDYLQTTHAELMENIHRIPETALTLPAADFFPQADTGETSLLWELISSDTNEHYEEHQPWMRAITDQPK
jgi:hypothetical protein